MAEQTTQGQETALDLDALLVEAANARADYESYRDNGWARDYAEDVQVLVAEVERLRAERDAARSVAGRLEKELDEKTTEALRIATEAWAFYAEFDDDDQVIASRALREIQRVLAGPSSVADYEALGAPVGDEGQRSYYDVVRSLSTDPDVRAAVDKAEADEPRRGCAYCETEAVPGLRGRNDWPVCVAHANDQLAALDPDCFEALGTPVEDKQ